MLARTRLLLWTVFVAGYFTALWGSFEWACTLTEAGLIESPIWSGTFGYPIPHHYLIGFIAAGASIIALELKRKHERRGREEEPNR